MASFSSTSGKADRKAVAVRVIEELIKATPFPAIANDWQCPEISCVAMNDHYVNHMQCPREMLMHKNNRVLDPAHLTRLPAKIRVGIRAAMAYGFQFHAHFESVKTANRSNVFMKTVSMRTVIIDGFRFVVAWQHTLGKARSEFGTASETWWEMLYELCDAKAAAAGVRVHWITEEASLKWQGVEDGIFEQTDFLCRKEVLDQALIMSIMELPFPAFICDPFLPECPLIGLNAAAQALTGWKEVSSEVIDSDKKLVDGSKAAERGSYHVSYGIYGQDEEEERLAVRAACANGRPCVVRFRRMYEPPSKDITLQLQGVTLAQGVNRGPLSGCDVWYLLGLLGRASDRVKWVEGSDYAAAITSIRSSVERILRPDLTPQLSVPFEESSFLHPYGGDLKLLRTPLWHTQICPTEAQQTV